MPALTSDWLISNIHIGNPSLYSLSAHKSAPMREKGQLRPLAAVLFSGRHVYLSIESHFVSVHGPYELHWKEKSKLKCNSYGPWTPTKCDSVPIFTSFYNKVCRGIAYFNTKMSYLSDSKRTKSKTLRTASTGRMTNWTKPPCDPVQIIGTKDWCFKSLIIVNTATSYFFTNVHVIYFWNGHRERRSSHWYLQLHMR